MVEVEEVQVEEVEEIEEVQVEEVEAMRRLRFDSGPEMIQESPVHLQVLLTLLQFKPFYFPLFLFFSCCSFFSPAFLCLSSSFPPTLLPTTPRFASTPVTVWSCALLHSPPYYRFQYHTALAAGTSLPKKKFAILVTITS